MAYGELARSSISTNICRHGLNVVPTGYKYTVSRREFDRTLMTSRSCRDNVHQLVAFEHAEERRKGRADLLANLDRDGDEVIAAEAEADERERRPQQVLERFDEKPDGLERPEVKGPIVLRCSGGCEW
jgi:hypothetical protein